MMFPLIFLISAQLLTTPGAGQPETLPAVRPACKLARVGMLWPPEANTQPAVLLKLSRQGALSICSRGTWRYRWTSPSVHISQLKRGSVPVAARKQGPQGGGGTAAATAASATAAEVEP